MKAHRSHITGATALFVFVASGMASAQTDGGVVYQWNHGSTVNVFTGAASASPDTHLLYGAAVGWEVTPRFALEGSGSWLSHRNGADAFAADLKVLVSLLAPRTVVPFVEGGVGLYRASFILSLNAPPDFYQRRMADNAFAPGTSAIFTDPSFILGGGINIFATEHIAVRPEIDTRIVRRNSQTYVVTAIAVRFAYHFEAHPVKPVRVP